jgi:antitoxin component YwqK of YwqJK toxin-antitoxin module
MKNYMSLLMLFSVFLCYGQKPLKDFYLNRSLKQDGLQYTFTVLDADKHGVWNYKQDRFYFWYKSQCVISTQGSSSGVLLNGDFESFYENKQLSSRGQFNKGLKEGQWLYWRKDGTLLKSEKWSNGVQLGTQINFDEQGRAKQTQILKRGRSENKVTDSLIITKKNHVQLITVYDSIGQVERFERRKNGLLDGKVQIYENGKRTETEKYKDGVQVEKVEKDSKIGAWIKRLFSKKEKVDSDEKQPKEKKVKEKEEKKPKAEKTPRKSKEEN